MRLLCLTLLAVSLAASGADSTIRIRSTQGNVVGHASGSMVDLSDLGHPGRRYVLTCAHEVIGRVEAHVNGHWVPARVAVIDARLDACVLELDEDAQGQRALGDDPSEGDEVTAEGYPRDGPLKSTNGRVVDGNPWPCKMRGDMTIDHGNSGGPVLMDGRIVGIVVSADGDGHGNIRQHTCNFVPAGCVRRLVRKWAR